VLLGLINNQKHGVRYRRCHIAPLSTYMISNEMTKIEGNTNPLDVLPVHLWCSLNLYLLGGNPQDVKSLFSSVQMTANSDPHMLGTWGVIASRAKQFERTVEPYLDCIIENRGIFFSYTLADGNEKLGFWQCNFCVNLRMGLRLGLLEHHCRSLCDVVKSGQFIMTKCHIATGIGLNVCDGDGWNASFFAAHKGYVSILEMLHQKGGVNLNVISNTGSTLAMHAIMQNKYKILKYIVLNQNETNNNLHVPHSSNGQHAIHFAARMGGARVVKLLHRSGIVDLNTQCEEFGMTPLMHAIMCCRVDVVTYLICNGANLDLSDFRGFTALDYIETRVLQRITPMNRAEYKIIYDIIQRAGREEGTALLTSRRTTYE
jgi:uncharacterized protein